jgi:integrator complex subunit 8
MSLPIFFLLFLQIKVIGLLELNANNNEEIQREAANIRKSRFLRAMARQYVC